MSDRVESKQTSRAGTTMLPWWIVAGPGVGILSAAFPHVTACDAIGLGFNATVLLAIVEFVIGKFKLVPLARWVTRGVATAIVGFGVLALMDGPADLFKTAFSVAPPDTVADLEVNARYAGGPGDKVVTLVFLANRATIDQLVKARGMVADRETVDLMEFKTDWHQFCISVFGGISEFGGVGTPDGKTTVPVIAKPEVYRWESPNRPSESTKLLWDSATGRAYAQWSFG